LAIDLPRWLCVMTRAHRGRGRGCAADARRYARRLSREGRRRKPDQTRAGGAVLPC